MIKITIDGKTFDSSCEYIYYKLKNDIGKEFESKSVYIKENDFNYSYGAYDINIKENENHGMFKYMCFDCVINVGYSKRKGKIKITTVKKYKKSESKQRL